MHKDISTLWKYFFEISSWISGQPGFVDYFAFPRSDSAPVGNHNAGTWCKLSFNSDNYSIYCRSFWDI